MKGEAVEKKINFGAQKKTKSSALKFQNKKAKSVTEKNAKPPKPQSKKTLKTTKTVSSKIVKQSKEIKPKAAKPETAAISKTVKQKSKTTVSVKGPKPKAIQNPVKEQSIKQKLQKRIEAIPAKDKKPSAKKVKTAISPQKSKSKVPEKKEKVSVKTVDLPKDTSKKPARKKAVKPISIAVFRGIKECYDFKVFPINEDFEAVKGVYIISKRKTDRKKRGHHKLVCIGQTDSIFEEIKKHRKSRCLLQNEANVISILPEENEAKRLKIETDLKAAHSISCNLP